jgi:hypothetical protein
MTRIYFLFGAALVLGAIAYTLGHVMEVNGIRTATDAKIVAQEKVEHRELATKPP